MISKTFSWLAVLKSLLIAAWRASEFSLHKFSRHVSWSIRHSYDLVASESKYTFCLSNISWNAFIRKPLASSVCTCASRITPASPLPIAGSIFKSVRIVGDDVRLPGIEPQFTDSACGHDGVARHNCVNTLVPVPQRRSCIQASFVRPERHCTLCQSRDQQ